MAKGDLNKQQGDSYPRSREAAAADWLRIAAQRYLKEQAAPSEVDEAVVEWMRVRGIAADSLNRETPV